MQEAFGGTSMMKLFMVFFVVYVCLIAIALNFAKAYRVKNYVINTLEQYQYTGADNDRALIILDNYLDNVPYTVSNETATNQCKKYGDNVTVYHGVCIVPQGETDKRYYKVVVFFSAEFPFLNFNMTIPASGETKVIVS